MEDSIILNAYVKEFDASPATRQRNLVAFNELLQMQCEVLRLLRLFATQDTDIRTELLGDKAALRNLVQMLSIVYQGKRSKFLTVHNNNKYNFYVALKSWGARARKRNKTKIINHIQEPGTYRGHHQFKGPSTI